MSTWVHSDNATGVFVPFELDFVSGQKAVEEEPLRLATRSQQGKMPRFLKDALIAPAVTAFA